MSHLLAVTALHIVHVGRLIAVCSKVSFLTAVSATTAAALGAVFGKMTGYKS